LNEFVEVGQTVKEHVEDTALSSVVDHGTGMAHGMEGVRMEKEHAAAPVAVALGKVLEDHKESVLEGHTGMLPLQWALVHPDKWKIGILVALRLVKS
jgi:hypothetical protein